MSGLRLRLKAIPFLPLLAGAAAAWSLAVATRPNGLEQAVKLTRCMTLVLVAALAMMIPEPIPTLDVVAGSRVAARGFRLVVAVLTGFGAWALVVLAAPIASLPFWRCALEFGACASAAVAAALVAQRAIDPPATGPCAVVAVFGIVGTAYALMPHYFSAEVGSRDWRSATWVFAAATLTGIAVAGGELLEVTESIGGRLQRRRSPKSEVHQ